MTYTINDSCTIISIDSDYLVPTNQVVNLFWSKNCGTLEKVSISPAASLIQLNPSDLNESGTFSDGVYYFKISITTDEGGTVEESLCKFVNCTSSCNMLTVYKSSKEDDMLKVFAFEALLASNDCEQCSCSDLCMLYNNTGLNDTTNDSDCGCN